MVQQPETRYAKGPGGDIAYQVVGDGPIDLVIVPGWISHVDLMWADPGWTTFVSELASFARVILYDKRGTGLSDPIDTVPTLENRTDDLRAVLDAAGSERAALFGYSEGGPIAILFAATYPERVQSLVTVRLLRIRLRGRRRFDRTEEMDRTDRVRPRDDRPLG